MTENTCYSHVSLSNKIKVGSVGQPLPLCQVKLSEKNEILIKHDALMTGYYKDKKENEIGFSSLRGGNIPGEHTVIFHGDNEAIELTHKAYNRKIFSDGAVEAAVWLAAQENGFYSFKNIELKTKRWLFSYSMN